MDASTVRNTVRNAVTATVTNAVRTPVSNASPDQIYTAGVFLWLRYWGFCPNPYANPPTSLVRERPYAGHEKRTQNQPERSTQMSNKLAAVGTALPLVGSKWQHATEPGVFAVTEVTPDGWVIWTEENASDPKWSSPNWVAPVQQFRAVFTEIAEEAGA